MARSQREGAGHLCRLCGRAEAQRDPSPGGPLSARCVSPRNGMANCIPALFTKSELKPGETLLVQGASGAMSTALIQLGRAAGFEIWATSRSAKGRELAEKLGAHRTFGTNEMLPRKVQAIVDNIGPATWEHSIASVSRGGTVIITGLTTGPEVNLSLLPMLSDQITVCGSIMGTLQDMKCMISFILGARVKPEIGRVLPMERAKEAFQGMWEGDTNGKTVFTR